MRFSFYKKHEIFHEILLTYVTLKDTADPLAVTSSLSRLANSFEAEVEVMNFLAIGVTGVNFGVKLVALPSRILDSVEIFEILIIAIHVEKSAFENQSPFS